MINDFVWHLKFYGTRGSTPVCDSNFQKYGGNTTCIYADLLINDRNKLIVIFDAGTGIRKLGNDIKNGLIPNTEHIMLAFTHFHWDHIQGLPFFEPAYNSNKKIALFSPNQKISNVELQRIFEIQMQKEFFPVQLNNMGAELKFFTAKEYRSYLNVDKRIQFNYTLQNHPGGVYCYRFECMGRSVVICTDIEHGKNINQKLVDFCTNADLLIHDAQYTDEELDLHRGWGHSSFSQAVECAKMANVNKLIFTHHDPDHDDEFMDEIEKKYQRLFANCYVAKEGMDVYI